MPYFFNSQPPTSSLIIPLTLGRLTYCQCYKIRFAIWSTHTFFFVRWFTCWNRCMALSSCLKKYYLPTLNLDKNCVSATDWRLVGSFEPRREIQCGFYSLYIAIKWMFFNQVGWEFISLFIFIFQVLSYLSLNEGDEISWALIQRVLASVAQTAIIPMQDVLGLGNSARMNIPATQVKCYAWCS